MSINSIPLIKPATEIADSRESGAAPSSRSAPEQPDLGSPPEEETASTQNIPSLSEMPKDEVEVQRDGQTNGEIVVRYMDHAGNLILQVPSEQVLNVSRGIDQDLEREQEVRAKSEGTVEGDEGGKSDGH
jgi:hypothetical protein